MSAPIIYSWPLADDVAIVNNVELGAGIRDFTIPGGSIQFPNISREISISSLVDLSLITFTITGTDALGRLLYEDVVGPAGPADPGPPAVPAFVYSVNKYHIVTSIAVNIDMTGAVDIGTGLAGYTNWFYCDTLRDYPAYSIQCVATPTMNYTFQVTLDNILNDGATEATINKFSPVAAMTAATTTQFATINNPAFFMRVKINSSNATGVLFATIMQQGGG